MGIKCSRYGEDFEKNYLPVAAKKKWVIRHVSTFWRCSLTVNLTHVVVYYYSLKQLHKEVIRRKRDKEGRKFDSFSVSRVWQELQLVNNIVMTSCKDFWFHFTPNVGGPTCLHNSFTTFWKLRKICNHNNKPITCFKRSAQVPNAIRHWRCDATNNKLTIPSKPFVSTFR